MNLSSFRRAKSFGGILIILLILFGCAVSRPKTGIPEAPYKRTQDSVTSLIQEEMKRHNVQGLSIALVDDQKIIWAQGFGYADVNNRIPAKPETIYPAGSIAKLFTVTAALQLAEQNRIDLDQPLQAYFPGGDDERRRFQRYVKDTLELLQGYPCLWWSRSRVGLGLKHDIS